MALRRLHKLQRKDKLHNSSLNRADNCDSTALQQLLIKLLRSGHGSCEPSYAKNFCYPIFTRRRTPSSILSTLRVSSYTILVGGSSYPPGGCSPLATRWLNSFHNLAPPHQSMSSSNEYMASPQNKAYQQIKIPIRE